MADNYQRGDFLPVAFQASGLAVRTLNIKTYTLELSSLLHDVTGTSHEGTRARIAGLDDAAGDIEAALDLDSPPYSAAAGPNIRNGVRGLCFFYVSTTKNFQVPVIIEKVKYASGVESYLTFGFSVKVNKLAGSFVYPAI